MVTPFLEIFFVCVSEVGGLLALFQAFPPPVFDCLQCAIQKGKAWEMWLCAVTSGRQRVDMWSNARL